MQFFKSGFSAFGHNVDGIQLVVQSGQFQIDNGMLRARDVQFVARFPIADVRK